MYSSKRIIFHAMLLVALALPGAIPLATKRTDELRAQENRPAQNTQNTLAPEAKIKVEAPSVVVDVIVTDKKGRHAMGLAAEDFRVYENDLPQRITSFIPPVPSSAPTFPEDGQLSSNTTTMNVNQETQKVASTRFITIVMDMGDLQPVDLKRACEATVEYLQKNTAPEDFVAVYTVDSSLHLAQPFTQDKRQAIGTIRRIAEYVPAGRFAASERTETQRQIEQLIGMGRGNGQSVSADLTNRELGTLLKYVWLLSTIQARTVFVALRAIAQSYADIPGRKNVIVFSEGFMHSPDAKFSLAAVIDSANRANVAFYIVDAAGLAAQFGAERSNPEVSVNDEMAAIAGAIPSPATDITSIDLAEHTGLDIQHDDLRQLAYATGGLLIQNRNDLLSGLALVDSDLREFYTLVYQPTNKDYDGAFRRIKVELLKPGYRIRHRLGYWAIPLGQEMMMTPAAAQLLAGVVSGEIESSFTPDLNAAVLLAPDGKFAAPVRITFPANFVKFEKDPRQSLYRANITLLILGRGSSGRLASVHQRFIALQFNKKQLAEFESKTVDISARLTVPKLEPLSVQAILQFSNGAVAIAHQELGLAESSGAMRLTSLLLTDRIEPAKPGADPSDPLQGPNFELYLPAKGRFAAGENLTAFFAVLDAPLDPVTHKARVHLTFAVKQGIREVRTLPPEEAIGVANQNRLLVLNQYELKDLKPGSYTFEVQAKDPTGQTASQTALFLIK